MIICAMCDSGHGPLPMAAGGQSSGTASKGYPLSFGATALRRRIGSCGIGESIRNGVLRLLTGL